MKNNREPIASRVKTYQCLDKDFGCGCLESYEHYDQMLGFNGSCPKCGGVLTVCPPVVDTMDNETYFSESMKTLSCDYPKIQERLSSESTIDLLHSTMGISTESGEALDMLKKHVFCGKPLDWVNLEEELGDLLWYVMLAITAAVKGGCHMSLETIFAKNIKKLKARYQGKFSEEEAENRDLEKERKILEGE